MSATSQPYAPERLLGLDRFVIERQLGEGSMGAVYLAYDRQRDAKVALKTLRRVDASGIYRFKREFRALADVSHPNLVVLHELFAEGADWFFTMEYVEGKRFLEYLLGDAAADVSDFSVRGTRELPKRGKPKGLAALFPSPLGDFDELRAVMQQIAEAIIAVHAAGKLHRDLKPDNVMVTDNGRAVVLDFGIATERVDDTHHTLEAGVMGTPAYMSPEQAAGGEIDAATDWYALGAMMFEAMTGSMPFSGSYMEVMKQKQELDPPLPSELVSGIPPDLDELCASLLSRDASARPQGLAVLQMLHGRTSEPRHTPSSKPPVDSSAIFVGRSAQLKELERALVTTDDGVPVMCFVQGLSGMGKSALLERFVAHAREHSHAVVLQGRCYERETMPFKAWDSVVDALCRYLGKLPFYAAAEVMPKDVEALAHIFPVLKRVEIVNRVKRRSRLPTDPRELRRRAFMALKELFARISHREPLVVVIDDLQWGDVESARLIVEMITGADRPAMLFLCAYRSSDVESSQCLKTLFDNTRENRQADIRQVTVGTLSEAEALELANQLLGESNSASGAAAARESRGNPYLLAEIVHHLRSGHTGHETSPGEVPAVSLELALSERLSRLPQPAFTLLELVAVAGHPVSEGILGALVPAELDLHSALTELRRAKLVRGVGSANARAIELFHDGMRDAVLSRMDAELVRQWHRNLAAALEAHGTTDLQGLTMHLIGAEDYSRAGIYAIRAAAQANRALAFEQAAELYAIAVKYHEDEAWRHELMVQWGDALVNARRGTQAAQVYLEAAAHAQAAEVVELHRKAGVQLLLSGEFERGIEVLANTLEALHIQMPKEAGEALDQGIRERRALEVRGLGFSARRAGEIPAAELERLDQLWAIVCAVQLTKPLFAQPLLVRCLKDTLDVGEARRIIPALCCYFINIDLFVSAREGRKARSLQLAEQLCREGGDPYARAWVALAQGFSFQNSGLLKPALLQFTQAEELFRNHSPGSTAEVRSCRHLSSWLFGMLGQYDDLSRCEQWMREAEERDDRTGVQRFRLITALGALVADDPDKAAERIEQATGGEPADPMDVMGLLDVAARTQLALYRHDPAACRALLGDIDLLFASPLMAVIVWRGNNHVLRARAALMASEAETDREPLLRSAEDNLAELEQLNLPHFADHARLLRASIAHLRGERNEALRVLDAILKEAEQAADGPIVLATARLCRARMVDTNEAERLSQEARATMRSRGVENGPAFARLFAPGFDAPSTRPEQALGCAARYPVKAGDY